MVRTVENAWYTIGNHGYFFIAILIFLIVNSIPIHPPIYPIQPKEKINKYIL